MPSMDARHVGRVLRAVREHGGRLQSEVALAAGLSQGAVSRAERGLLDGLPVGALDRLVGALGGSLYLDIRFRGGAADRLIDRVHAAIVDHVTGFLGDGWEVVHEYTFNHFGERGSVDILAWHAATRTLLIVEVKSGFADLQELLFSLGRKLRLVPDAVRRERGWDPDAVGRVVVVAGTTSNRSILQAHRSIFDVSFPARSRAVRAWIRRPSGPISGVWFVSADAVPTLRTVGSRRRRARDGRSGIVSGQ